MASACRWHFQYAQAQVQQDLLVSESPKAPGAEAGLLSSFNLGCS